ERVAPGAVRGEHLLAGGRVTPARRGRGRGAGRGGGGGGRPGVPGIVVVTASDGADAQGGHRQERGGCAACTHVHPPRSWTRVRFPTAGGSCASAQLWTPRVHGSSIPRPGCRYAARRHHERTAEAPDAGT